MLRGAILLAAVALLAGCSGDGQPLAAPAPAPAPDPQPAPEPPPTETTLTTTSLAVPNAGYTAMTLPEFQVPVLASPPQQLTIPPHAVAFVLTLTGPGVGGGAVEIVAANNPDAGLTGPLKQNVFLCDPTSTLCSLAVPRRPDQAADEGNWTFRLGTTVSSIDAVDFSAMRLRLALRTGPAPDTGADFPARLAVQPFLTTTAITPQQLQAILDEYAALAAASGITIDLAATRVIDDERFREVSTHFTDPDTAALVSMGTADAVNIFFIEGFRGIGGAGQIGIAPGIPGELGTAGPQNGVLINATVTLGDPGIHTRTTAEFALHESLHLLGLYHTTEGRFDGEDVLDDTPVCDPATDLDADGRADPEECPDGLNLMFWSNAFSEAKMPLTADQRDIVYRSVIARPGP